MARKTGVYHASTIGGENVRAFTPHPLPPKNPVLNIDGELADTHNQALAAISRLKIASAMVPSPEWFLYGFVRRGSRLVPDRRDPIDAGGCYRV